MAAAWLLLQVADVVLPALALPDWTITAVVIAVIAGLPTAIFLSWLFDWTPEGIKRDKYGWGFVREAHDQQISSNSLLDRLSGQEKTLAVLPFLNLSGDPDQEYFCDGLVEDVITDLALIPGLLVISRNSTFAYKGGDIDVRQIGEELNVNYVMQGSIRRSNEQLRITARVVKAETGENVWSKRYDRDIKDIFDMQDDLTNEIVTALDVKLVSGEQGVFRRARYRNREAGDALYKGMYHHYQYEESAAATARAYFEKVVQLEPDSILGYVWLVTAWAFALVVRWEEPEVAMRNLGENVSKALAIDPNDPQALTGETYVCVLSGDLDRAIRSAKQAVNVAPSGEEAWFALGWTQMCCGDANAAIRSVERSARLCPVMNSLHWGVLATAYRNAGRYEEAIDTFKSCLKRFPGFVFAHAGLAVAYSLKGDDYMAEKEVKEVLRQEPGYTIQRFASPNLYRDNTVMEASVEALRKAGMPEA